jgi:hypothetical protein
MINFRSSIPFGQVLLTGRAVVLFLLAGALPLPSYAEAPQQTHCSIVEEAKYVIERTRETKFTAPVACRVKSKSEIGEYIKTRIREEVGPCDLEYEGIVLRALGMFPESFDYPKAVHSIYESALGGFYDPRTKSFSMADWTPPSSQRGVAIHELGHALQDQQWDLERFVDSKSLTGDEVLARMSLVEGEATALVLDAEQRAAGQAALADTGLQFADGFEGGFSLPFSADYPEALQQLVQFPYTAGLRYVVEILRGRGYQAIDAAFKSPPRSTEEILHPEKRHASAPDFRVLPAWSAQGDSRKGVFGESLYHDTMGEFVTRVVLRETSKNSELAVRGAEGWGGDRVDLFRRANSPGEFLVVWQTSWDTHADATEFLHAFLGEGLAGLGVKRSLSSKRSLLAKRALSVTSASTLVIQVWFKETLSSVGGLCD